MLKDQGAGYGQSRNFRGKILLRFTVACTLIVSCNQSNPNAVMELQVDRFEPTWESLEKYEVPTWFCDAKFGIFIHWGVYSVPAFRSEWYPRLMYMDSAVWNAEFEVQREGPSSVYTHHVEKYGHPGKFGYKDFIHMFKAEQFDADGWMEVFKEAGAKYIVPVAEHHDAFAMYDSKYTRWNAVEMGPKRDVLKELFESARKMGLKVGASSHYAFNWSYFNRKPAFDNWNPEFFDLYGHNLEKNDHMDEKHLTNWWNRTTDIVDNYQPDIMWFDFYWDKEVFRPYHKKFAAYYYNKGLEWNKEVVLQGKNFGGFESFPGGTFLYDLERGKLAEIRKEPWQTDTSIGKNSWGYVSNWMSKTPNQLIDDLVDIVSKNGCLLLNVGPKADGTLPEDQVEVLLEIGKWLQINGQAIYGSRPWWIFGEGPTAVAAGHHTEGKNEDFTSEDFRFTTNKGKLYAILLEWPKSRELTIKSLGRNSEHGQWGIDKVRLLGHEGELIWEQNADGLKVDLPQDLELDYAATLEIDFGAEGAKAIDNSID
ncbi:MAG: alpha-L-fucosidase [Saprospiraceae bacterium]|nr:alpha-L-fucosidase [Saprospiraceae bacterium]